MPTFSMAGSGGPGDKKCNGLSSTHTQSSVWGQTCRFPPNDQRCVWEGAEAAGEQGLASSLSSRVLT